MRGDTVIWLWHHLWENVLNCSTQYTLHARAQNLVILSVSYFIKKITDSVLLFICMVSWIAYSSFFAKKKAQCIYATLAVLKTCNLPSRSSYIRTKLFLIFSSEIFPKYDCITSMIFRRNSNTIAAFTFCFVTAANQMFARWKQTEINQILKIHLTNLRIPEDYWL